MPHRNKLTEKETQGGTIAMPLAGPNRRTSNLLSILMVSTLASYGCGRSSSSIAVSRELGREGITIEEQELDFGPILETENSVKYCFRIANTTENSVKFTKVSPSCACSDAHLDKNELAPGEDTSLRLVANIKGRAGKQRFTCRIDRDRGPSIFCSALATVYPPVEFEAPHVSLGALEHSASCSFTKKLYINTSLAEKERYKIANFESPQGVMDAKLILREERVVGNQIRQKVYDVNVNLLPNATSLPGNGSGSLILTYTDQKGSGGTVVMGVSWTTPEHLQITPTRIAFGSVSDTNLCIQKDAILECSSGSEPSFRIIRTTSSHPGLSVLSTEEVPGANGRRYRIHVALNPSKIDRFFSGFITIFTDHPSAPTARLPVVAYKSKTRE